MHHTTAEATADKVSFIEHNNIPICTKLSVIWTGRLIDSACPKYYICRTKKVFMINNCLHRVGK